jgi:LacI family transcriptional regulator
MTPARPTPRSPRPGRLTRAAPGPRVSIHEVAGAARVSVATVSRVLNHEGLVRDDTRRLVLDAIARLGYVPHAAARSLITRQTRTIGMILPDIYGEFFSELIRGADLTARRHGYHLLVSGAHSDPTETREAVRMLHGRVDGLVLMAPAAEDGRLDGSLPGRLPVIVLNDAGAGVRHASLRVDNRGGARAMTEHLLALGHRRIAFIQGPPRNHDAAERRLGYRDALAARGFAPDPRLEIPGDFSDETGHRAATHIAGIDPRPTAVFAANDAMAIGCLAGLRERGLRVPEDVALAGFDDIPVARYMTPPLTTVHVAIAEVGGRAIARLLDVLESGTPLPLHPELLPTTLVVRASCGAPHPASPTRPRRPATSARPSRSRRGGKSR